jgi:ATP-dependent DNA helicase DinG
MRKEASGAHIIVVNHHLLFADLTARFQGAGYENAVVLPPFTRLIIDEAHKIETAATSFFSSGFSRFGLFKQLGRLYQKKRASRSYGLLVKLCAMLPSSDDPLDEIADAVAKIKTCAEGLDDISLEISGQEGLYRLSPSSDESFFKRTLFPHFNLLRSGILNLTNIIRNITENLNDEKNGEPLVWEVNSIMRRLEGIAEICEA